MYRTDVRRVSTGLVAAILLATLVGASAVACDGDAAEADATAPSPAADERPELSAKTLAGEAVELRSVDGPVLVNLWATWCAPCLAEMPELRKIRGRWQSEGLRLVGVSTQGDDAAEKLEQFRAQNDAPFDIWYAPEQELLSTFEVSAIPATFVYDRRGRLVWSHDGPVEGEAFDELQQTLADTLGSD